MRGHWYRINPAFDTTTNKRHTFIGLSAGTIGTAALMGGGIGLSFLGNKKQDRNVPDPLAGLRQQLQALAGQVPAQVAKQKEINAARALQYKTEGQQGIAESVRGERGFGASSIEERLKNELYDKLLKTQQEGDLAAENWGIGEPGRLLMGTAGMYPEQTELPEEENWGANLLGVGANMAMQNYMQENQWKNLAKYLNMGGGSGGTTTGGRINPAGWENMMADPYANVGASIYSKLGG